MHISKLGGALAAGALLATPAAALAAGHIVPANGKLTGTPHYKFRSQPASGKLTVTVAGHRISAVELRSTTPPLDAAKSHGEVCGAVTDLTSKGHHATGTVSPSGRFHYTFSETFKQAGKVTNTDTITLVGRFKDARHASGTFRDVSDFTAASAPGVGHCDSGSVKFSVMR